MQVQVTHGHTPNLNQDRVSLGLRDWEWPVSICLSKVFSQATVRTRSKLTVSFVNLSTPPYLISSPSLFSVAVGLARSTSERTAAAMQVNSSNPMVGIEGRTSLLLNLSDALKANQTFFGKDSRPGNLVGMQPLHPFSREHLPHLMFSFAVRFP